MIKNQFLNFVLESGEGQFTEFKEAIDKSLSKEMVAVANASGGSVYLGITDFGDVKELRLTNKIKSEIQNIARNCDPPVSIELKEFQAALYSFCRCRTFKHPG